MSSETTRENENPNGSTTTISFQRRRRKRNRLQQSTKNGSTSNETKSSNSAKALRLSQDFFGDDSSRFAFLDKDGDELVDKRPQFKSLPILLEERRNGILWRGKQKKWQSKMLFNFTKKPAQSYIGRRQWRPFVNRRISFTRLGSPATDAVLAMQRNADYVLTLGTMTENNVSGLALRFYGINSVASRMRRILTHRNDDDGNGLSNALRAPLLQTTPLQCEPLSNSTGSDEQFDLPSEFSPSNVSVEILVSKDWKVGVALLSPPREDSALQTDSQEVHINAYNGRNASMVFFTLPRRQHSYEIFGNENRGESNVIFDFGRVPMACKESRRKMLWLVETIPNQDETNQNPTNTVYDSYFQAPGYLLLNYEGMGVRINWAAEKHFLVESCLCQVSVNYCSEGWTRSSSEVEIISHAPNSSWRESYCNKMNGTTIDLQENVESEPLSAQVSIVNESFLHLDVLLAEVLSKRKGMSETRPDFCYSLVCVNGAGRIADFVIAFTRTKKACSLGFYVTIDLFSGMFVELDWVRSKAKPDTFALQKWCNNLALNRRMRELRAGPFAVTKKYSLDCTRFCTETFTFDNDEDDDYDESYWREFVSEAQEKKNRCEAPKLITLSSLYPCCDVITNQAIINFEPVMSIRAKDSPIQLVYT